MLPAHVEHLARSEQRPIHARCAVGIVRCCHMPFNVTPGRLTTFCFLPDGDTKKMNATCILQ